MKILFVGLPYSIHSIRWINQMNFDKNEIYFISSIYNSELNLQLDNRVAVIGNSYNFDNFYAIKTKYRILAFNKYLGKIFIKNQKINYYYGKLLRLTRQDKGQVENLKKIIKRISPDIVHSFETQNAGYIILDYLKNNTKKEFLLYHSLWGSDLFYFQYLEQHLVKLKDFLPKIDFLLVEGNRDLSLSQKIGFKNKVVKIQATGSFDAEDYIKSEEFILKRDILLIRARQDQARRGLIALRALERSHFVDINFEIHFYDITEEVDREIGYIKKKYPSLHIIKHNNLTRSEFIKILRISKYHMSISRSDGMPNTLIECMANGVVPIQSKHSCADEIITHSENGYLVGSDDTDEIAIYLNKLPLDNDLFSSITRENLNIVKKRYSSNEVENVMNELYN